MRITPRGADKLDGFDSHSADFLQPGAAVGLGLGGGAGRLGLDWAEFGAALPGRPSSTSNRAGVRMSNFGAQLGEDAHSAGR